MGGGMWRRHKIISLCIRKTNPDLFIIFFWILFSLYQSMKSHISISAPSTQCCCRKSTEHLLLLPIQSSISTHAQLIRYSQWSASKRRVVGAPLWFLCVMEVMTVIVDGDHRLTHLITSARWRLFRRCWSWTKNGDNLIYPQTVAEASKCLGVPTVSMSPIRLQFKRGD